MVDRPDPLTSPPPAFTEAAARLILHDGFGLEASLTPLAGERDQNFRAETAGGERFLLKISNPVDGPDILGMQTAALAHIERADPALPVMRTRPARAGEPWTEVKDAGGRDCAVRLFTYLPGHRTGSAALTVPALREFGRVVARLGRALRGFFHPAADYEILWDLTHALKLRALTGYLPDAARQAQVNRILDRFETRVSPGLPGLRAQVIHADLSLDNVLLNDDLQVSGIVDFGDMTHAPLVFDLAVTIADVLQDRADALDAAEAIIAGYTSVTPLEDEEAGILADLVATRLAMAVTVIAWRRALYPDHAGYSGPSERGFLDVIDAAGADEVTRRLRHASRGLPYRQAGSRDLLARRRSLLPRSPLFYAEPLHLVRGEGVWLFDPDGRRYLDCYNNVPVAGHSHPRVAAAISAQQRLLATHNRYLHEAIVDIAGRFRSTLTAGLDAVLLVNSGSEANDLAWRIARAATGRSGAVVTDGAYHGVTEATHALSPEEWAGERPRHVATVPAPDGYRGRYRREEAGWAGRYAGHVDAAAAALGGRGLAAMYLDPACTSAGILVPPPGYLREVAARVHALGGLLVADEVQAGYGRLGAHLWSFHAAGIEPDLVVTGKPMGNGFPVAAVAARSGLLAAIPEQTEVFSTFGGNPVACVAALAVLDVIEDEGLVENAAEVGGYLRQGLAKLAGTHPVVGDVRGAGLLLGVELVEDREARTPAPGRARAVTEAMRARGVLLGATGLAGNVLKIRPPLVFGREHADLLLATLDDVLGRESAH